MTNINQQLEIWKDIPCYEGYYQVSNHGRIKFLERICYNGFGYFTKKEKILCIKQKTGYITKCLMVDNIGKSYYVHRLVALSFITNSENKPFVNHIDGNKQNNRSENLEWVTAKENTRHAVVIGSIKMNGEDNKMSKLKKEDVLFIRQSNLDINELAKIFEVKKTCIDRIITRKRWGHI